MSEEFVPTKLQRGRPSKLTPETKTALYDAVKLGAPIALCAAAAGIGESTFLRWMKFGREEAERIENDLDPDPAKAEYLEFFEAVTKYRVAAATRNVALIQKSAQGGFVTEETVKKYRDHDGNMVEEKTTKKAAPDWRASAWYLERQWNQYFGKEATKVELTGAEGGPIQVAADADDLSKRLSAHLAAGVSSLALPAATGSDDTDIVDADVIENATAED